MGSWVCRRGYLKVEEEQVIIHREGKFKQGEAGDEEADLRVDGWWEERKEVEARGLTSGRLFSPRFPQAALSRDQVEDDGLMRKRGGRDVVQRSHFSSSDSSDAAFRLIM